MSGFQKGDELVHKMWPQMTYTFIETSGKKADQAMCIVEDVKGNRYDVSVESMRPKEDLDGNG